MRITRLLIRNFRSFKELYVDLDNYTALIGPNGSGKSTILDALNFLFRRPLGGGVLPDKLEGSDLHRGGESGEVLVAALFSDLEPRERGKFNLYLRRGGGFVFGAMATLKAGKTSEYLQFGTRRGVPEFRSFFEASVKGSGKGKKQALQKAYQTLRAKEEFKHLADVDTVSEMLANIKAIEKEPGQDTHLYRIEDSFYGDPSPEGANKLAEFVQWVHIPAARNLSAEGEGRDGTYLGELLGRAIPEARQEIKRRKTDFSNRVAAEYEDLLEKHGDVLSPIEEPLRSQVRKWAHPGVDISLSWGPPAPDHLRVGEPVPRLQPRENAFAGDLTYFGHGLQRSLSFALLEELADPEKARKEKRRLIIGYDEPELHQHPQQTRRVARVLRRLADRGTQVVMTTHSPLLVSEQRPEELRIVRDGGVTSTSMDALHQKARDVRENGGIKYLPLETMQEKLRQDLQVELNEMFFARRIIFVEGPEDAAYIEAILSNLRMPNSKLSMWEVFLGHNVSIIPTHGKDRLIRPLMVAKSLEIPSFVVFDVDEDKREEAERLQAAEKPRAAERQKAAERLQADKNLTEAVRLKAIMELEATARQENAKRKEVAASWKQHEALNQSILTLLNAEDDSSDRTLGGGHITLGRDHIRWKTCVGGAMSQTLNQWEPHHKTITGEYRGFGDKHPLFIEAIMQKLMPRSKPNRELLGEIASHLMEFVRREGEGPATPPPSGGR